MANAEMITFEAKQEFANPILNKGTQRIVQAILTQVVAEEESKFEKAKAIGEMICGGVEFEKEGFTNYEDYAKRMFNWGKSTAYTYRSVGIGLVRGLLPERDANGIRFKFSALHEMCNMPDSGLRQKMVDSGEITATDTTEEIRQTVKASKPARVTKRTEKQYQWFTTTNTEAAAEVATEAAFLAEYGKPFHDWTDDGRKYYLYIDEAGVPTVYYRTNAKVVEAK